MHEIQLFLSKSIIKKFDFVLLLKNNCIFAPVIKDDYLWKVAIL